MTCICPECGTIDYKVGKVCTKTKQLVCIDCCRSCEYYFRNEAYMAHGCRYGIQDYHSCNLTKEEMEINNIKARIHDKADLKERILARGWKNDLRIANRIDAEISRLKMDIRNIERQINAR